MRFQRKDNNTNKLFYLGTMVVGLVLIYLGYTYLWWGWNLLIFPIGLMIVLTGYKNYKKENFIIEELEFIEDSLRIKFLNGEIKEIKKEKLSYSLLVQKFYQPVRSIEFIEKKSIGFFRGKSIGKIEVAKWNEDIESIAKYLIRMKLERKKWKFGWSIGDFLMLFSLLFGMAEGMAGDYAIDIENKLSYTIGELGETISDERARSIQQSQEAEKKFLNDNENE